MKKSHLALVALAMLWLSACKKQFVQEKTAPVVSANASISPAAALACQPGYYQLQVDPSTGFSYLNKITGSPTAPGVTITPVIGSGGTNQLTTCSGAPIRFATGISYDPASGTYWGTTGASSSPANHILKFTDPNCISITPAVAACGIVLDLSDVERDPASGAYYAINRGTVNPNNRIVKLGLPGAPTVNCLTAILSPSIFPRGLTFTNAGRLYIITVTGNSGRLHEINTGTGAIIATYTYPGPITPSPAVNVPELGLHFDGLCIGRFITANYDPVALAPLLTDGLPTGLGGPVYASLSGVIRPTVDFSHP